MVLPDLESHDIFVKLTEEARRDRQRLINVGRKSAVLNFNIDPKPKAAPKFIAAPKLAGMATAGQLNATVKAPGLAVGLKPVIRLVTPNFPAARPTMGARADAPSQLLE